MMQGLQLYTAISSFSYVRLEVDVILIVDGYGPLRKSANLQSLSFRGENLSKGRDSAPSAEELELSTCGIVEDLVPSENA